MSYDYHGHTVLKCGPWSQGPVFLQQLALLRGFDIGAMDPFGNDFVHTVVECAKLAYADRDADRRPHLLTRTPGVGEPTVSRLGVIGADTCHLDVIDKDGNMVSATPSGGWLQSSPVIPALGFCMGTRGQMFWLQP